MRRRFGGGRGFPFGIQLDNRLMEDGIGPSLSARFSACSEQQKHTSHCRVDGRCGVMPLPLLWHHKSGRHLVREMQRLCKRDGGLMNDIIPFPRFLGGLMAMRPFSPPEGAHNTPSINALTFRVSVKHKPTAGGRAQGVHWKESARPIVLRRFGHTTVHSAIRGPAAADCTSVQSTGRESAPACGRH